MMNPYVVAATAKVKLAEVKKLLAYLGSVASLFLTLGILPTNIEHGVAYGLAVLGGLGVYQAENLPREYRPAEPPVNADGHGEVAMSAGAPGKHAAS